jgi:dGTPase
LLLICFWYNKVMTSQLFLRPEVEKREQKMLASYAVKSGESQGRKYLEEPDWQRTCFQRDRDRVIHSRAFRRLKGKTQVFVSHYGDHFRTRLTHTMEVAQIARDLARSLGANEDLVETIALAHDLGHTPFGHAGEEAMQDLMHRHGMQFEHNQQSRRIVELLEEKSSFYPGLNLSLEVLDGLHKHQRSSGHQPSLEGQIVDVADAIAYLNHDIDDGLRSGFFQMEDLRKLEIWRLTESHMPDDTKEKQWLTTAISTLIKLMSRDLLETTTQNLESQQITTLQQVQMAAEKLVAFSAEMEAMILSLRHFLFAQLYKHPSVRIQNTQGKSTVKQIFFGLQKRPELMPHHSQKMLGEGVRPEVVIKDFIAGMTDDFALQFVEKLLV